MRMAEKLLLGLSRKPGNKDYPAGQENWSLDDALALLCREFPDFSSRIAGKNILDFGCGNGWQSVALAKMGAKYVLGLDTNRKTLKKAEDLAKRLGFEEKVEYTDRLEHRLKGVFDLVISQNSMEHFGNPSRILDEMKVALNQNGSILISFGPLWLSPYGSHMQFFTKVPWVNILFSENTVMSVRSYFRDDGATKYEEVESGLNKLTVAGFERIISDSNLRIYYKKYACIKGLNFIAHLPFIREFFINHISCELINCA